MTTYAPIERPFPADDHTVSASNELIRALQRGAPMTLMTLGAHNFRAPTHDCGRGGAIFDARILPFTDSGERSTRARTMTVTIIVNAVDLLDVEVAHGDTIHYSAQDIFIGDLTNLLVALDWDGPTPTNPGYWSL